MAGEEKSRASDRTRNLFQAIREWLDQYEALNESKPADPVVVPTERRALEGINMYDVERLRRVAKEMDWYRDRCVTVHGDVEGARAANKVTYDARKEADALERKLLGIAEDA